MVQSAKSLWEYLKLLECSSKTKCDVNYSKIENQIVSDVEDKLKKELGSLINNLLCFLGANDDIKEEDINSL